MQQDISNFEIERAFNEVNTEDLKDAFLGVYPSNKINSLYKKLIAFN